MRRGVQLPRLRGGSMIEAITWIGIGTTALFLAWLLKLLVRLLVVVFVFRYKRFFKKMLEDMEREEK